MLSVHDLFAMLIDDLMPYPEFEDLARLAAGGLLYMVMQDECKDEFPVSLGLVVHNDQDGILGSYNSVTVSHYWSYGWRVTFPSAWIKTNVLDILFESSVKTVDNAPINQHLRATGGFGTVENYLVCAKRLAFLYGRGNHARTQHIYGWSDNPELSRYSWLYNKRPKVTDHWVDELVGYIHNSLLSLSIYRYEDAWMVNMSFFRGLFISALNRQDGVMDRPLRLSIYLGIVRKLGYPRHEHEFAIYSELAVNLWRYYTRVDTHPPVARWLKLLGKPAPGERHL